MKYYSKLLTGLLLLMVIVSCNDKFEGEIIKDSKPAIPVTFDGSTSVGFNPYYQISYAGNGAIVITLSIPADSKSKIKQVENIVAGATSINVATITTASSIQYLPGPVPVNGTTYTLNTSITEFNTKVTAANKITSGPATGTPYSERAFQIRLRMDDDTFLFPVQVRLRIAP